jgi:hypothetical protein
MFPVTQKLNLLHNRIIQKKYIHVEGLCDDDVTNFHSAFIR